MEFVDDQASVSKGTPTRKRFGSGSPSNKRSTVSPWKRRSVSHAVEVLAKIHADLSGSVSVIFPKEAERLREEIKNMLVDDARACHWNRNLMKWSNERYDSTNENRVLNCDPIPFLEALQALADSSEYVSELKIMGPLGNLIDIAGARNLDWKEPESAALGCARPPARVSKKEAVTAGFRRKKQYHLEVETTSLAIYLTVGFRRKKQYHLEVEPTLWRLQMNYIEKTML
jgi:hypothetical protein